MAVPNLTKLEINTGGPKRSLVEDVEQMTEAEEDELLRLLNVKKKHRADAARAERLDENAVEERRRVEALAAEKLRAEYNERLKSVGMEVDKQCTVQFLKDVTGIRMKTVWQTSRFVWGDEKPDKISRAATLGDGKRLTGTVGFSRVDTDEIEFILPISKDKFGEHIQQTLYLPWDKMTDGSIRVVVD
tara:strand:+ start:263 stop:826 length:564 start_codon:yes stop_codon:yes gene_type:complete